MTQTYPSPITNTMLALADAATARFNPTVKDPGISTGRNVTASLYEPDTLAEKATAAEPDQVFATEFRCAINRPYPTT